MNEVKPGRREINATRTRRAIQDAALDLFATQGYAATSIEQIARKSGASVGAVYHHFQGKRSLFADLYRSSQDRIIAAAVASAPSEASVWEIIELETHEFLRGYVRDHGARALLRQAVGVLGWEQIRAMDEAASLPLFRAVLSETISSGESLDVPVETAAEVIFSMYCSSILAIAASEDPEKTAAEVEVVISTLLRGLRTS